VSVDAPKGTTIAEVIDGRIICDEVTAAPFGVTSHEGFEGAPLTTFVDAIHDEDGANVVR
jgi:hypothetical protein